MNYTQEQKETMKIWLRKKDELKREIKPSDVTQEEAYKILGMTKQMTSQELQGLMLDCRLDIKEEVTK